MELGYSGAMGRDVIRRSAIGVAAWSPFFVVWTAVALSSGQVTVGAALIGGLISMGSAGALGILVWFAARRWPWPLEFRLTFYALQIVLALAYGAAWTALVFALEFVRGAPGALAFMTWPAAGRQILLGLWLYAVFAGISHAVQTRMRLHEKETLAARAEALASAARLEAIRARLNPHFLFNALNSLRALIVDDRDRARRMVTELAEFLRYTLVHRPLEHTTLAEELEALENYLAIERSATKTVWRSRSRSIAAWPAPGYPRFSCTRWSRTPCGMATAGHRGIRCRCVWSRGPKPTASCSKSGTRER